MVKNSQHKSGEHPRQALVYDLSGPANSLTVAVGKEQNKRNSGSSDCKKGNSTKIMSFVTIEYYQQFFDVDTLMVFDRIASAMIPKRAPKNYLKSYIETNPDLYGPFWIIITLIFCIAISGNIASYLQTTEENHQWRYKFYLVSYCAASIFIYTCFIPVFLWALMKYCLIPDGENLKTENGNDPPSLLSLMCIYGYSLAIYIPISILWIIQVFILQCLLLLTAAFASGSVLIFILTPSLKTTKYSILLVIGILISNFILGAGFIFYCFHLPHHTMNNPTNVLKSTIESINIVRFSNNTI